MNNLKREAVNNNDVTPLFCSCHCYYRKIEIEDISFFFIYLTYTLLFQLFSILGRSEE